MQTYSHFLITAAVYKLVPAVRGLSRKAVYLGSVAPDFALLSLSLGSMVYFRYVEGMTGRQVFRHIYGTLFFTDPYWIVLQNMLQAPILLISALMVLWWKDGRRVVTAGPWFAFFASCLLHATIDILTHHDDGPLVYFPFDWSTRFYSPVSYWDRDYYGGVFSRIEHLLDVAIAVSFALPYLFRRFTRIGKSASEAAPNA